MRLSVINLLSYNSIQSLYTTPTNSITMKAIVALVFLGVVALSYAGLVTYNAAAVPAIGYPYSIPYAYTPYSYNTAANYKLTLDTSLPGSAYTSAAPTAYGYGVYKAL